MNLDSSKVTCLINRCKKNNQVSKNTLELLDWMLAIDFDVSKIPAAGNFLPEEHLQKTRLIKDRFKLF